jgi:hypothetical protein
MISNVTNFYNFSLRFDEGEETMDKNELERRLEAAEKQNLGLMNEIKWLKEKLAEQDKKEIPDFPEFNCGDVVYEMDSCFDVMEEEHGGGKGDKDFIRDGALFYNAFHTGDYAHELRRKCLMIAMMLHCKWYLERNYVPDWESDTSSPKHCVIFDHCRNGFQVRSQYAEEGAEVYFSTEEAAQKCADWLNAHWKESTEVGDTDEV